MTVQEVAKLVMRISGLTQSDIAKKAGLPGQSTVSMYLRGKSMRVDSLQMILNTCGYELVARSADGKRPEFVIGEELRAEEQKEESKAEETRMREMVKAILEDEMKKAKED